MGGEGVSLHNPAAILGWEEDMSADSSSKVRGSKQGLDEFLKTPPPATSFIATVESVSADERVKVTPWVDNQCRCEAALTIAKSAIAAVTPTGDVHSCCGKHQRVVEVEFTKEGAILASVFEQMLARSNVRSSVRASAVFQRRGRGPSPRRPPPCQVECYEQELACIENGGNPATCYSWYEDCLEDCRRIGE